MAKKFLKINSGVGLTPQTSAPSDPVNGDMYYDNTLNAFRKYENGAWSTFGAGGSGGSGKNYISNGNFENNSTTGWSLGTTGTLTNGIPTGSPTFGSGASGNLSISTISSGQLAGSYSLSYASSAATTQGNMLASDALTIDAEDRARVLTWKYYYKAQSNPSNANWSGTSSNSFGVAVYDETNSTWLGTAGQFSMTQSSGVGYSTGTFQTGATTASIRFVIYNVNATSGAITLYFDDFSVGPQTAPMGPAMSDWTAVVPTFQGFGTVSSVNIQTRRVGDSLEISGGFVAGTVTGTEARMSLVYNGATVTSADSSKIPANQVVGAWAYGGNFGANIVPTMIQQASVTYINFGRGSTTSSGLSLANGNDVSANNAAVVIYAKVPIAGWSSNVQMSNDTDTRVVAMSASLQGSGVVPNNTNIPFVSTVDTHSAYSNGVYTVPVSGKYKIYFKGETFGAAAYTSFYQIKKNGFSGTLIASWYAPGAAASGGSAHGSVSIIEDFKAGDTICAAFIQNSGSASYASLTGKDWIFTVERLSGPAVVAATESVNAKYKIGTNKSPLANNPIDFDTKTYDSHNAVTTGSSWKYTAPVSGVYSVKVVTQVTSGSSAAIILRKNGSNDTFISSPSTTAVISGCTDIKLNAGDYIDIVSDGSFTFGTNGSISIARIGN